MRLVAEREGGQRCSLLGSLAGLGGLAGGGGGLTGGGSLAEGLASLLGLVPVEVLLELAHGHLVGSLGGLLASGGGHGSGLLATDRLLSGLLAGGGSLLGSLFLGGLRLGGGVLDHLLDGLLLGGLSLLSLGGSLGGSLSLALSATLNLGDSDSLGLGILAALLLDKDVLEGDNSGGALLEGEVGEVVTLAGADLHDAFNLSLGGGLHSGEVGQGLSLALVGGSLQLDSL